MSDCVVKQALSTAGNAGKQTMSRADVVNCPA